MATQLQKLTLFYDGKCPLCQAEILFLSDRNKAHLLDFIDIHTKRFDPQAIGVSCEQALAAMYGQYADGTLIHGVRVFPEAYQRVGLPFLAWIFSRPALQPILQGGYKLFANNRHGISKVIGPGALWLVKTTQKTSA